MKHFAPFTPFTPFAPPARYAATALVACAILCCSPALAQTPATPAPAAPTLAPAVAVATSVEGTAYVTRADGRQTVLARGSAMRVGDALSTTRNTTVRLRFTDGGETAVRPESRMTVQEYSFAPDAPEADNLILSLLKGGMRAITGRIGKRGNVDAYRLQVGTATIGIRGTDYTARLCNGDCGTETAQLTQSNRSNAGPPVIARLLQASGAVTVERGSRQVDVAQGAALYASDRVSTPSGGHAVLAFRDDTRMTLNSGTTLALTQYSFDSAQPGRGSMLFNLIAGGLRVATGLIGKAAPSAVKFKTSTATIGIRGTLFDMACGPANAPENPPAADVTDVRCDESLYATTRDGEISLAANDGAEIAVGAGQSALVPGANGASRALTAKPGFFNAMSTPAPENVQVNLEQLFGGAPPPQENTPGVYLMVREGKITVEQSGQSMSVDAGESAFAGAGQSMAPVRLMSTPILLDRDPALSNSAFNFNICRR